MDGRIYDTESHISRHLFLLKTLLKQNTWLNHGVDPGSPIKKPPCGGRLKSEILIFKSNRLDVIHPFNGVFTPFK